MESFLAMHRNFGTFIRQNNRYLYYCLPATCIFSVLTFNIALVLHKEALIEDLKAQLNIE